MIAAKETVYNGYRFRSRLEARWAVFFDALGVQYQYEKETFELSNGRGYLPDFWLPQVQMWAEVKPDALTEDEDTKCRLLAQGTQHPCLLLIGAPAVQAYMSYCYVPESAECMEEWWWLVTTYLHEQRFYYTYTEEGVALSFLQENSAYKRAVEAAQQARFEWGERGAPRQVTPPPAPRVASRITPVMPPDDRPRCTRCRTMLVNAESIASGLCRICTDSLARAQEETMYGPPPWRAGDRARHEKFGEGIVVQYKHIDGTVMVAFPECGIKRFLLELAQLEHVTSPLDKH